MHQRVLDQGGEHLGDGAGGADGRDAAQTLHLEHPAGAAQRRAPLLDLLLDDLVQVEGDGGRAARVALVGEQSLHHVGEPLDLLEGDGGLLPDGLGLLGDGGDLLQPHRERGERRPQLVGGVGGEAPLGGEHPGDPLGADVEHLGHPVEFGHAVPAVARTGVAGAEPFGGLGEVGERPGEALGLPDGEGDGRLDGEQRDDAEQQQHVGDLVVDGRPGLLDDHRLAAGPVLHRLEEVSAGRPFAGGDQRLAGDVDLDVAVVGDLGGELVAGDRLPRREPVLDQGEHPDGRRVHPVLGGVDDGALLDQGERYAEHHDHHQDDAQQRVDHPAFHAAAPEGSCGISSSRTGSRRRARSRCSGGWPRRRPASCAARRCACRGSWSRSTRWCPRPGA